MEKGEAPFNITLTDKYRSNDKIVKLYFKPS